MSNVLPRLSSSTEPVNAWTLSEAPSTWIVPSESLTTSVLLWSPPVSEAFSKMPLVASTVALGVLTGAFVICF